MNYITFNYRFDAMRINSFFRDLKALMDLWKQDVKIVFADEEIIRKLEKYAMCKSEDEEYKHFVFRTESRDTNYEKLEELDIRFNSKTREVKCISWGRLNEKESRTCYEPQKEVSRIIVIEKSTKQTKKQA